MARSGAFAGIRGRPARSKFFARRLRTWLLGALWSLKPPRLYGVPGTLALLGKYYAGLGSRRGELPDPRRRYVILTGSPEFAPS